MVFSLLNLREPWMKYEKGKDDHDQLQQENLLKFHLASVCFENPLEFPELILGASRERTVTHLGLNFFHRPKGLSCRIDLIPIECPGRIISSLRV